jgi:hypothetical protein
MLSLSDIPTMTIAATTAGVNSMVSQFGMFFRGGNRDNTVLASSARC